MDDTRNGHEGSPEPTPEGRARLLTALDLGRARHPVEPGQLGEYVELLDRDGLAAARAAFPSVAAHLAAGCDACNAEVRELRELAALDETDPGAAHAERTGMASTSGAAGRADGVPVRAAPAPMRRSGPRAPANADAVSSEDPGAAAALRRRQKRVLMTGLTAVAAVAMAIMGASLYALLSLTPRSGPAEIKLIARETLDAATPVPAVPAAPAPSVTALPSASTAPGSTASAPTTVAATVAPAASPGQPGTGSFPKPGAAAGPGSAAPSGNDCPDSHPVKANRESSIYHLRGGAFYDRTRPEVCFATAEDAERAGYRRSQR